MTERHRIDRVRYDTVRRTLQVVGVRRITPRMVRIDLCGEALAGFVSAGHDDHVKLFFPDPNGGADAMAMRDFTPRRYDMLTQTLTIDFALHADGVATRWAEQAAAGQTLTIGGPRGSFVVTDDFDGYLLIGDETALPAIARRLEELRPDARVQAVIAVAGTAEEQALTGPTDKRILWVHRSPEQAGDPATLLAAVSALVLPAGDLYAWAAAESGVAKALRRHLVEDRGLNPKWVTAAGYWRHGAQAVHEVIAD